MREQPDYSKNFMPQQNVCHRELRKKDRYTVADLWDYLWLSLLGRTHPLRLKSVVTTTEVEQAKQQILAERRPMDDKEQETLYSICEEKGVQTVLFAIDIYCMDEGVDDYYADQFRRCLKQGAVEEAAAIFRISHPEVHR